ncbi:MAG: hypothetical protein CMH38_03505 [Microbacterium sp.]|uniref:hypothetical protein n=1 Tax=Microbacterium sp. TaxID=51671 RepID=UPI000C46A9C0|nr:hypothetical protein [Microbacterium sp.]MAY48822.1 hypothetical protein [Microbacterium sp.]MAY48985.1 hypothetical protein [Microbacterium sp.]|tara:strand:- start:50057 stop:50737 length:681 start_codon:yes stop_codon:yes gene_type:complete
MSDEWGWCTWVPQGVRDQVEDFWRHHGGEAGWRADMLRQGAPKYGAVVTMDDGFGSNPAQVTGMYVHAWNNIGRIVMPDGTFRYTSFVSGRDYTATPEDAFADAINSPDLDMSIPDPGLPEDVRLFGVLTGDGFTSTPDGLLARARAVLDGVTEGPWVQVGFGNVQQVPAGQHPPVAKAWRSANGEFIAQSRTLVPELVALAARQAAEIDRLSTELDTANTKAAHP